jgi:hypothetical protein
VQSTGVLILKRTKLPEERTFPQLEFRARSAVAFAVSNRLAGLDLELNRWECLPTKLPVFGWVSTAKMTKMASVMQASTVVDERRRESAALLSHSHGRSARFSDDSPIA